MIGSGIVLIFGYSIKYMLKWYVCTYYCGIGTLDYHL